MVYCILTSMVVCGTLYLSITSFYPLYTDGKYGKKISTVTISFTLVCFNLAGVVCTPIHAITIGKMGRKNALLIGFWAILISNTALGLCSLVSEDQPTFFIILCCVARFV
jgi:predicted MFS family arabinose efflux permease